MDAGIKNLGRLDILVNNCGVYEFSPIESFTEEQFHKIFNINVLGLLLTTQAAVPHLGEGASIINIGSVVSSRTPPGSTVYTATKGAVDAISGVLAKELGTRKIRVNSINPGMVETEGVHAAGFIAPDFEKRPIPPTPPGRLGPQAKLDEDENLTGKNDPGVRGAAPHLADHHRLYDTVKREKGKIDVLFASAGQGEFAKLEEVTEEHFDKTFALNVRGTLFTVQKALPLFNDNGSIFMNGSIATIKRSPAFGVYRASKAAVRSFARTWLVELKERRIRVN